MDIAITLRRDNMRELTEEEKKLGRKWCKRIKEMLAENEE